MEVGDANRLLSRNTVSGQEVHCELWGDVDDLFNRHVGVKQEVGAELDEVLNGVRSSGGMLEEAASQ